jgi:hypothetical protein
MGIEQVLREQGGVISRRQVIDEGGDDNLIERNIRRRIWRAMHPGVYVDHTGTPTEDQAALGAVLYAWPAALGGTSALAAHGANVDPSRTITVAIDHARRVRAQPGVRIMRLKHLGRQVQWNRTPPRQRIEPASLYVASERLGLRGEAAAVAVLADVCQRRLTTVARLQGAIADLRYLPGRAFLAEMLGDVASGAYSLLEHRYLTKIERPHGLPEGSRQQGFRNDGRAGFRDVAYKEQRTVVELDGRLGHEWASDQWADLERDLRAATEDLLTIRLGWGATGAPSRVAGLMGQVLRGRGWSGVIRACPDCS